MSGSAEGDGEEAGRAAVRSRLVQRLAAAGLRPARGQTQAAVDEMGERLVRRLSYMSPAVLDVLAETLLDAAVRAQAPHAGRWPSEVAVLQLAEALQSRPPERAAIVTSWLASVEGPVAEADGSLVTLYRWLVTRRRPPTRFDRAPGGEFTRALAEDLHRLQMVEDRIARGAERGEDRPWLESWRRSEREARALVDAGREKRAAKAAGAAEQQSSEQGDAA